MVSHVFNGEEKKLCAVLKLEEKWNQEGGGAVRFVVMVVVGGVITVIVAIGVVVIGRLID